MKETMNTREKNRLHCRRAEDAALHDLVERHRMISALGQIITSEIDLDRLFELIVKQMTSLMKAETCSVFLHDPDTDELWSMVSNDLNKNRIRISARCGISGWVYSHRTPQIVNAPYEDPRFFKGVDRETGFHTRNILCIPMVNRSNACIGTLQVLNKREGRFTEADLEVFEAASHYVTIALENAQLVDDLKALDTVKQKIIHHLSHELKTPLAILKGTLRLFGKRLAPVELAKVEKGLDRGLRNVERLSELQLKIDDILTHMKATTAEATTMRCDVLMDLIEEVEETHGADSVDRLKARIREIANPQGIHKENLDLGSELLAICEMVRTVLEKRDLCLMRQFDRRLHVYTDRNILRKVCGGLLKNAIENTPDEGCIEVTGRSEPNGVVVEFRDHGMGITEADQNLIFSGFFTTQPTDAYASKKPYEFNAGGAGVDLLRIKTFADQLNFHVDFKSRRCPAIASPERACPGKISICPFIVRRSACVDQGGSTFVIRFPPG